MSGAAIRYFDGITAHVRRGPRHRLSYRQTMALIRLTETFEPPAGVQGFRREDHGFGGSWREFIDACRTEAGLDWPVGRVELLTMPRLLGYVFNPISVWFLHRTDGVLGAVIYEVHSTFGQRHAYVAAVDGGEGGVIRHRGAKAFHVSPMLPMDLAYDFALSPPDGGVGLRILVRDAAGETVLATSFEGKSVSIEGPLWRARPLQTLKVIAAIHLEALVTWLKGAPPAPDPGLQDHRISVLQPASVDG
jgi:uncharacterized protein